MYVPKMYLLIILQQEWLVPALTHSVCVEETESWVWEIILLGVR